MSDGWASAAAADLGVPPPPPELAARVRSLEPHRWGTLPGTRPLRGLGEFADDFEQRCRTAAEDYVVAGIESIGTNLDAIHYHVVRGRTGLFVQARTDAQGRETLDLAAEVQDLAFTLDDAGMLGPPGQLVVLHSDFGTRWWKWTGDEPAGDILGLDGAVSWLRNRALAA